MKRVILLVPYIYGKIMPTIENKPSTPFGVLSIAAMLKKNNIVVDVIDMNVNRVDLNGIVNFIDKNNVQYVGVSCSFPNMTSIHMAKMCKKLNKNIRVIFGGPFASYMYKYILKYAKDIIDIIILGEGEIPFTKLVYEDNEEESFELTKVKLLEDCGYAFNYKDDLHYTGIFRHENLNLIPSPYLDTVVDIPHYYKINLFHSRGCPFGCDFCIVKTYFGRKVRYIDESRIADEIEYLNKVYNKRRFSFIDDTFGSNIVKSKRFISEFKKKEIKNCEFWIGTRFDTFNEELISQFHSIGLKTVAFGTESINYNMRQMLHKNMSIERIKEIIKFLHDRGITVETSIIFGLPFEGISEFKNTVDFLSQLDFDIVHISNLILIPGAEIYENILKYDIYKEKEIENLEELMDWNTYRINSGIFTSKHCTLKDLEEGYKYATKLLKNKLVQESQNNFMNKLIDNPYF